MIVTRIEQLGRSRYKIYLDDKTTFVLYRGELKTYDVSENKELTQDNYDKILSEVLVKRARLRAMNLLMKHSFTVRQLRNKLSDGGYPDKIVDDALDYVISYGYVNDEAYALDYIECHREDKSVKRIKRDLANKGIDGEIINNSLAQIMESYEPVDEFGQIKRLLDKKHYDPNTATYEEKQKLGAFLFRKGFDMDMIRKSLDHHF